MGLKDIYIDIVGFLVYWAIRVFHPRKSRDVFIGWLAYKFGIFDEEEFERWMPKKLAEVE